MCVFEKCYKTTTLGDSSYVGTITQNSGGRDFVDPDVILANLGNWWSTNSKTIFDPDHIMHFTRYDLQKGGSNGIVGFSYVGGICLPGQAVSTQEDTGFLRWLTAAHELGHNLGANNDGVGNLCPSSDIFIMQAGSESIPEPKTDSYLIANAHAFSDCTKTYFKQTLFGSNNVGYPRMCLTNQVCTHPTSLTNIATLPGQTYTKQEQCELYLGAGTQYCESVSNPLCVRMACQPPGSDTCFSSDLLTADGTDCDTNKWCIMGECVDKATNPAPGFTADADCVVVSIPSSVPDGCTDGTPNIHIGDTIYTDCTTLIDEYPYLCFRYDTCCGTCAELGLYNGTWHAKEIPSVATTSWPTTITHDASTDELISSTVQPDATATETASNTNPQDSASTTAVKYTDTTASLTIGTTNSHALQTPPSDLNSPEITTSWPSFGPAAGGTWITVTGIDLPVERNMTISIGDLACETKQQNSTKVIGITKGLHLADRQLIGKLLPVSLTFDTVVIRSSYVFTFKENPVINKVHPTESIIKGGTLLTVEGKNLDSVAVVWMEVIMILKTLKSLEPLGYNETRTLYATKCQLENQTRMHCPTPILDIPSGFLNQKPTSTQVKRDINRQSEVQKAIVFRSLDIHNLQRRLKRETVQLQYSNDGDILEFYVGFRLDGVHDFENVTAIDVYTEPTFNLEVVKHIFKAGERLSFNGNGLDSGITMFDYAITIGRDDCVDLELLSNSLSCYPPQRKPEVGEDGSDTEDPQITIHVGLNLQHFVGYLRYPDRLDIDTNQKLPVYIIILTTVIPAGVIIIIIAAVCAKKKSRGCGQRQE